MKCVIKEIVAGVPKRSRLKNWLYLFFGTLLVQLFDTMKLAKIETKTSENCCNISSLLYLLVFYCFPR